MKAEILTIGDELLRGEIIDSNKAVLSERLLRLDIETRFHTSVRDDPADMEDAFRRAAGRADVILVSGGLGPTRDDLTSEVLGASFGRTRVLDAPSLAALRAFYASVGREMCSFPCPAFPGNSCAWWTNRCCRGSRHAVRRARWCGRVCCEPLAWASPTWTTC